MKGAIFTNLQDLVESQMGIELWDEIIESCDLASEGIYTFSKYYPDEEILQIVAALSEKTKIAVPELLQVFGKFLFAGLHKSIPDSVGKLGNLFDYLASVHSIIHVEVRKLDTEAEVPELDVMERSETRLVLAYRSPKNLCFLAIGLIEGVAELFDEKVLIAMPVCKHDGASHCELVIEKL